jgi:hypothetical protein
VEEQRWRIASLGSEHRRASGRPKAKPRGFARWASPRFSLKIPCTVPGEGVNVSLQIFNIIKLFAACRYPLYARSYGSPWNYKPASQCCEITMVADLVHLTLDSLALAGSLLLISYSLYLGYLAGGGAHLDLVSLGVLCPLLAYKLQSMFDSVFLTVVASLSICIALKLFLVVFIFQPVYQKTKNPSAILISSYCVFQLVIMSIDRLISSNAIPAPLEENFLGGHNIVSNLHLVMAVGLSAIAAALYVLSRKTAFYPAVLCLNGNRAQLLILGKRPSTYQLLAFSLSVTLATAGVFNYWFLENGVESFSAYPILLMSFPVYLFMQDRSLKASFLTGYIVAACYTLLPYFLSARFTFTLLSILLLVSAILHSLWRHRRLAEGFSA